LYGENGTDKTWLMHSELHPVKDCREAPPQADDVYGERGGNKI